MNTRAAGRGTTTAGIAATTDAVTTVAAAGERGRQGTTRGVIYQPGSTLTKFGTFPRARGRTSVSEEWAVVHLGRVGPADRRRPSTGSRHAASVGGKVTTRGVIYQPGSTDQVRDLSGEPDHVGEPVVDRLQHGPVSSGWTVFRPAAGEPVVDRLQHRSSSSKRRKPSAHERTEHHVPPGDVDLPGLWTPAHRRAESGGRRGGRPQAVGNLAGERRRPCLRAGREIPTVPQRIIIIGYEPASCQPWQPPVSAGAGAEDDEGVTGIHLNQASSVQTTRDRGQRPDAPIDQVATNHDPRTQHSTSGPVEKGVFLRTRQPAGAVRVLPRRPAPPRAHRASADRVARVAGQSGLSVSGGFQAPAAAAGVLVHAQVLQHESIDVLGQGLHDVAVAATPTGHTRAAGYPCPGRRASAGHRVEQLFVKPDRRGKRLSRHGHVDIQIRPQLIVGKQARSTQATFPQRSDVLFPEIERCRASPDYA